MENNEVKPSFSSESRREFIKKTATAAAVVATANVFKTPVYGQNKAPSTGRVIGANDRILVGYIGVGGQGQAHVDSQKRNASENNIVQAAVCDVSKTRIGEAKKMIGSSDVTEFEDYRKLLERKRYRRGLHRHGGSLAHEDFDRCAERRQARLCGKSR